MKFRIGIVGFGTVGRAVGHHFQRFGHDVRSFDLSDSGAVFDHVLDCDAVFVCVPTDALPNGGCDCSHVTSTLCMLSQGDFAGVVIIKSTMTPGSTRRFQIEFANLQICFVPEFLRQDHAIDDYIAQQKTLLVGCDNDSTIARVKLIHQDMSQDFVCVSPTEAEFAKYFANTFNAMRVVFANAFYHACKTMQADYDQVLLAAQTKGIIDSTRYLLCNKDLGGFGGRCLPKDTRAFAHFLDSISVPSALFHSTLSDNDQFNQDS